MNNTQVVPISFRDRSNLRQIPPIPEHLIKAMYDLEKVIGNLDLSDLQKLTSAYAALNQFNAFVATFAVCQKGCSHCCKMDVQMSHLEAEFIMHHGGPSLENGQLSTGGHTSSCRFLSKDGSCGIYSIRPFHCRTFHTLDDPKYCADGKIPHQTYGSAAIGYGVPLYAGLANWLKDIHQNKRLPYRDIRDWFPS